ncbi:ZIP zinc transporter-domain-containing protein [Trametes maxima]|nr:ZIP zinc transporter-domain-containing protein [Trametes maxima]
MASSVVLSDKSIGKLPAGADLAELSDEDADVVTRLLIMLVIFIVSLAAVSFPTITETYRSVRVPSIFFFVGKHFGTGVILSTAFVHLLQDAFKALLDPAVNDWWRVADWAGMIVLGSLLAIFLVEYISTAFVDRLHSYSSAPSSPTISPSSSPASSIRLDCNPSAELPPSTRRSILVQSPQTSKPWAPADSPAQVPHHSKPHEPLHQVGVFDEAGHPSAAPLPLAPPELADDARVPTAHHHNETTPLNASVFPPSTTGESYGTVGRASGRPSVRPSIHHTHASAPAEETFFSGGHHRYETRGSHSRHHAPVSRWSLFSLPWFARDGVPAVTRTISRLPSTHDIPSGSGQISRSASTRGGGVSRHQSVRGHEHGHGHGRSGSGHDGRHAHAHLDMEEWMAGRDGRRHSSAGASDEECRSSDGCDDDDEDDEEVKVGRRRQVIGILVLQMGIMIHSLVIGLTLSITSGPEFTSLVVAIVFHQLFEGLSLGIRIAGLPSKHSEDGFKHISGRTLKPLLAITFATTTPLGIAIGIVALGGASSSGPRLTLVQGVMSAISAGMLIYAACVEMLAGDFVMDAHLWRSPVRRQVLALVSLFAGVAAMAAIGL